jgi:hypothetical protein
MTFALAMLVSVSVATTAEAKKPKTEEPASTEQSADAEKPSLTMATTGIADVDNVFNAAVEPLKTIQDTQTAIDNLTKNLNTALGLADGGSLSDALNDLKKKADGKIQVAMNDKSMPTLKPSDAVPENVQKAIDGVNASIDEISALVPKLASLPDQFKNIAAQAAAFNPASLMKSGVKATEAPKIMKSITGNIKVLNEAPNVVTGLLSSVDNLKNSISSTFSG